MGALKGQKAHWRRRRRTGVVPLETKGVGLASVRVAPETVPRTLAVLDHLIRAVENLGHSIAMHSSPAAMLLIDGVLVPVAIFEKFVRSHEPADTAEMKRRHVYERKYPKFFRMMDLEGGLDAPANGQTDNNSFERIRARPAKSLGGWRIASCRKSS
jgi:hypothetical protein